MHTHTMKLMMKLMMQMMMMMMLQQKRVTGVTSPLAAAYTIQSAVGPIAGLAVVF